MCALNFIMSHISSGFFSVFLISVLHLLYFLKKQYISLQIRSFVVDNFKINLTIILALEKLRQNCSKFEAFLGYTVRHCIKKKSIQMLQFKVYEWFFIIVYLNVDFEFVFLENSVYVNPDPIPTVVNNQLIYSCVSLKGSKIQREHCGGPGWPHVFRKVYCVLCWRTHTGKSRMNRCAELQLV